METVVLYVYGLWFWLTRSFRIRSYNEAAVALEEARIYLARDFAGRASTRERGALLPDQLEALAILDRHSAITARASRRFQSLAECCHFIFEELTGAPAQPIPMPITISLPERKAFTVGAVRSALLSLLPDTRSGARHVASASPATSAPAPIELPEAA